MDVVDSVWTKDTESVQDDDKRMEDEEKYQNCERNFKKKLQNCKRNLKKNFQNSCPKCEKLFTKESSQSLQSTLEVDVPQFNAEDSMMDVDFDGAHFKDEGESLSEVEVYEGAGTCYAQDGVTFLDLFDTNEYAECRKENLFYPFASKEEWEVADFLLCSPLNMAAIN
ncbi:hypothetical protein BDR04DRAFT_1117706 [Suillus decipiens]|nr:hypothetical protein BDR04DRAFT_1117706 [Suillus decipiens]